MKKSRCRSTVTSATKVNVEVERERGKLKKRTSAQDVTTNLSIDSLTPYLESVRHHVKFLCDGFVSHSLWKSDLVKVLQFSIMQ